MLVGSRFLAVAHSLVLAGTLAMPRSRFVRYTLLGAAVWASVYVGLGSAASAALRGAAHLVGPGVTAVAVVAGLVALGIREMRRRRVAA